MRSKDCGGAGAATNSSHTFIHNIFLFFSHLVCLCIMRTILISFGYIYINFRRVYFMWIICSNITILSWLSFFYDSVLLFCFDITLWYYNHSALISYANLCSDTYLRIIYILLWCLLLNISTVIFDMISLVWKFNALISMFAYSTLIIITIALITLLLWLCNFWEVIILISTIFPIALIISYYSDYTCI